MKAAGCLACGAPLVCWAMLGFDLFLGATAAVQICTVGLVWSMALALATASAGGRRI